MKYFVANLQHFVFFNTFQSVLKFACHTTFRNFMKCLYGHIYTLEERTDMIDTNILMDQKSKCFREYVTKHTITDLNLVLIETKYINATNVRHFGNLCTNVKL